MQKTKKVSKIIDKIVISSLITFIIFTTALSIFFTYYKSQNKTISLFGYSIFYVLTGSMVPALEIGDVLFVKIVEEDNIKVGKIITYKSTEGLLAGNYITHRVVAVNGEGENLYFYAKGDANTAADTEVITIDKVKGIYQRKIGFVKVIMSLLSNRLIFLLIVIVPLFAVLLMQLINFFIEVKKQ